MKNKRKPALAVALFVLAIALAASALACGTSAPSTKTYQDDKYGFTFTYPASWKLTKEGTSADVTAGAPAAYTVGLFNPAGAKAGEEYIDYAEISIYQLNAVIDESMLPQAKAEVEATLASLESQAGNLKIVEPLSETTVGQMKGFRITYFFPKDGVPATSTLYFLFWEDTEYFVAFQAADSTWEASLPVFQALLNSLQPGPAK